MRNRAVVRLSLGVLLHASRGVSLRWGLVAVVVMGLALAAGGCDGRPSKTRCKKVAGRMVEIFSLPRLGEEQPPAEVVKAGEAWREQVGEKDPTFESIVETCTSEMTDDAADCVLEAKDEAGLAGCFAD